METVVILLLLLVLVLVSVVLFLLFRRTSNQTPIDTSSIIQSVTTQLSQTSFEALNKAQTSFLELADTRFKVLSQGSAAELDQKKTLIDQQLNAMKEELSKVAGLVDNLEKERFPAVLRRAQTSLLELAETSFKTLREGSAAELDQKKSLIDQQLTEMKSELGKVSTLVSELEKDRTLKFGELTSQLKMVGDQTALLTSTANTLREALANTRVRGQCGERMAEDILRIIGFQEGINYHKQKTVEGGHSRPDFTFLLPGGPVSKYGC
ncbi:MAG: DNA recombination protein RmuC [SAR202 cluster bacterium]|nr:DNA recombination protein RmuC [SAR202 cluster bacterium]